MRHVLHLVSADVRRFRLLLAVWLLIQVLDKVFTGVRPALASDPGLARTLDLLGSVLFLARWLGLLIIVPLVMQTHALVGSEAFWMTRPIPWRTLFASKILLLGTTFVVVPALCELVLMAACGVPAAQIVRVSLQTVLFQALWLIIIMALSAATRDLARFALVLGGVLVGAVVLLNVLLALMIRGLPEGPQLTDVAVRSAPSPTAMVVLTVLLITAALVQILVQYRTRSTYVAVGAGLTVLVAAVLGVSMWPWHERPLPVPAWAGRDAALRLVAASPIGEFTPLEPGLWGSEGWQIGHARLRLSGMEAGWLGTARLADATAQFDDGTTLTTVGNEYSATVPFEASDEPPDRVVMRHVLKVGRLWRNASGGDRARSVPAIVVREADFTKYSGARATYRGRFLVHLDHSRIAATLPLVAGAEYRDRRIRLVIDRVIPQPQAASVLVRQFGAASMFDTDPLPALSFYLRNRARAEAVAGPANEGMAMSGGLALPLFFGGSGYWAAPESGFNVTSHFIRFPEGYGTGEGRFDISAEWLSQAELVFVYAIPAGSVTRTIEIPGFEVRPAPPPPRNDLIG